MGCHCLLRLWLLASEIKQTSLSTNLASVLASKLQADGPPLFVTVFLVPNARPPHSRDTWLPSPPPHPHQQSLGFTTAGRRWPGCCEGPDAGGSLALSGGLGGLFRAAASTTCLRDHPRVSPAWHWLPADAFPWWNGNMRLDELRRGDPASPLVCTLANFSLGHKVLFGRFCLLVLIMSLTSRAICVGTCLLRTLSLTLLGDLWQVCLL